MNNTALENTANNSPTLPQPDAVLHLAGEQPLPVYFGIQQIAAPRHVIAVTEKSCGVGETIKNFFASSHAAPKIDLLELDAYDLHKNINILQNYAAFRLGKWFFNLTGGTKPMFAAAYRTALEKQYPVFYIETVNHSVAWLDKPRPNIPLKPALNTIDLFIKLAGYKVHEKGSFSSSPRNPKSMPEEKKQKFYTILEHMWQNRLKLLKWHDEIRQYAKPKKPKPFHVGPKEIDGLKLEAELKDKKDNYTGSLSVGHFSCAFPQWDKLAQFIIGGWFEEFIAQKLTKILSNEPVKNWRCNIGIDFLHTETPQLNQELDLAFTDGFFLSIIECKTGPVRQEYIQKLENLVRKFGGDFSKGIIIYASENPPPSEIERRIKESKWVALLSAEALITEPAAVLELKPGQIKI